MKIIIAAVASLAFAGSVYASVPSTPSRKRWCESNRPNGTGIWPQSKPGLQHQGQPEQKRS
jgi:hypothetical protein